MGLSVIQADRLLLRHHCSVWGVHEIQKNVSIVLRGNVRVLHQHVTLGKPAICGSFSKCPKKLLALTVLLAHFSSDKTVDLGSSIDTFLKLRIIRKLLDLCSFMDSFPTG